MIKIRNLTPAQRDEVDAMSGDLPGMVMTHTTAEFPDVAAFRNAFERRLRALRPAGLPTVALHSVRRKVEKAHKEALSQARRDAYSMTHEAPAAEGSLIKLERFEEWAVGQPAMLR